MILSLCYNNNENRTLNCSPSRNYGIRDEKTMRRRYFHASSQKGYYIKFIKYIHNRLYMRSQLEIVRRDTALEIAKEL